MGETRDNVRSIADNGVALDRVMLFMMQASG